jgi:hypothetical protein
MLSDKLKFMDNETIKSNYSVSLVVYLNNPPRHDRVINKIHKLSIKTILYLLASTCFSLYRRLQGDCFKCYTEILKSLC